MQIGVGQVANLAAALIAGLLFAVREARLANPDRRLFPVVTPLLAVGVVFVLLVLRWGF